MANLQEASGAKLSIEGVGQPLPAEAGGSDMVSATPAPQQLALVAWYRQPTASPFDVQAKMSELVDIVHKPTVVNAKGRAATVETLAQVIKEPTKGNSFSAQADAAAAAYQKLNSILPINAVCMPKHVPYPTQCGPFCKVKAGANASYVYDSILKHLRSETKRLGGVKALFRADAVYEYAFYRYEDDEDPARRYMWLVTGMGASMQDVLEMERVLARHRDQLVVSRGVFLDTMRCIPSSISSQLAKLQGYTDDEWGEYLLNIGVAYCHVRVSKLKGKFVSTEVYAVDGVDDQVSPHCISATKPVAQRVTRDQVSEEPDFLEPIPDDATGSTGGHTGAEQQKEEEAHDEWADEVASGFSKLRGGGDVATGGDFDILPPDIWRDADVIDALDRDASGDEGPEQEPDKGHQADSDAPAMTPRPFLDKVPEIPDHVKITATNAVRYSGYPDDIGKLYFLGSSVRVACKLPGHGKECQMWIPCRGESEHGRALGARWLADGFSGAWTMGRHLSEAHATITAYLGFRDKPVLD